MYSHVRDFRNVSMNENSWQHWRAKIQSGNMDIKDCFHEWKFMATLKGECSYLQDKEPWRVSMNENSWQHWRFRTIFLPIRSSYSFPWMKIHGNIEGRYFSLFICLSYYGFHEWKFMATLKVSECDPFSSESTASPWMKIHGNIEGCGFASQCRSTRLCFHEWRFMATLNVHEIRPTWGSI